MAPTWSTTSCRRSWRWGRPICSFRKYLEAIKGHKRIIAKPGQVIQIGSLTATIVSSNGAVLPRPLPGAGKPNPVCDSAESKALPRCGRRGECPLGRLATDLRKVKIAMFGDLSWQKERELSCSCGEAGTCQSVDRHPARLQHFQQSGFHR